MSETGFRDLFIELPRAVFDALQAIGEGAVAKAGGVADMSSMAYAMKTAYRPTRVRATDCVDALMRRYGWVKAETRMMASLAETYIIAELECGHRMLYELDDRELLLCASPAEEIKIIDRVIDRKPRRCSCVMRPPA